MWKRFGFFERSVVQQGDSGMPHPLIQNLNPTCCSSGRSKVVLGDAEGRVHILDREFTAFSWDAFDNRVTLVYQMKTRNILVAIGNDKDDMDETTIKMYNLDKREGEEPLLLRSIKIQKSEKIERLVPVTCMAVHEDLTHMAIGLCNGAVIQILGDLLREKNPRQRVIMDKASNVMVTGLGYASPSDPLSPLYCVTSAGCFAFIPSDKEREKEKMVVLTQQKGADLGCVTFNDDTQGVFADDQGIFFFGPDGLKNCYVFDGMHSPTGRKKFLIWFRSYLVVVSSPPEGGKPMDTLHIYDLTGRFVAFTDTFERITHMVAEWGSLFALTADRKMYRLEEKDIQTKMEILFKKNHYDIAIMLALRCNYDVIEIYREYGNHLYDKKEYDKAMVQYIKTIGSNSSNRLEPSYVIRKYLDAQRIHNLTSYLQKLHEQGLATSDHTTLLLNCYTKLQDQQDRALLDEFVRDSKLNFEVETAIRVCRQAGYHDHALFLARKHNEHNWYLRIMLEDLHQYSEALRYLCILDFFECEKNMKKYGKVLVTAMPAETTQILMELCTQYKARTSKSQSKHDTLAPSLSPNSSSSSFPPSPSLVPSVKRDETNSGNPFLSPSIGPSLNTITSLLRGGEEEEVKLEALELNLNEKDDDLAVRALVSNPEDFIHIYVDNPDWLIVFLEFMVEVGKASEVVTDTLFELYLSTSNNPSPLPPPSLSLSLSLSALHSRRDSPSPSLAPPHLSPPEDGRIVNALNRARDCDFTSLDVLMERKRKAQRLLENAAIKYDPENLLMLSRSHNFQEGLLFLYEKLKMYSELMNFHMTNRDHANVLKMCQRYGEADPSLWRNALSYFAEQDPLVVRSYIQDVLVNIDRRNLLSPLMVIEILSRQPKMTLETVKDYVSRRLIQQNQFIRDDERNIKEYQEETERMRQEIKDLKTSARVFQLHKCSYCTQALDLPAVHFLCMHSYHQRCLNDNEKECPSCSSNNRKIMEIKKSLDEQVGQHDSFVKQLDQSQDGFTTVAEYFGRGLFRSGDEMAGPSRK